MATPQIYDAPRTAAEDEAVRARAVVLEKKEIAGLVADPLRSFEKAHHGLRTELLCWMTRDEKTRIEMVKTLCEDRSEAEKQRDLNFVIWFESLHPKGSRSVAALAFNKLFPQDAEK